MLETSSRLSKIQDIIASKCLLSTTTPSCVWDLSICVCDSIQMRDGNRTTLAHVDSSALARGGDTKSANRADKNTERRSDGSISRTTIPGKSSGAGVQREATGKSNKTDELDYNDPTKFWAAWSERRHECLQSRNDNKGCQCFEGLGSVM